MAPQYLPPALAFPENEGMSQSSLVSLLIPCFFCKAPDLVLGGLVEEEPVSAYLGDVGPELVHAPGFAVSYLLVRVLDAAPVSNEVDEPGAVAPLGRSRLVLHLVAWIPGETKDIAKPNVHQEACAVAAHGAGVPLRAGAGASADSHNFVAILVHFEVHERLVRGAQWNFRKTQKKKNPEKENIAEVFIGVYC